jgi:predicted MFS family arabinose efflux permease
LAWRSDAFLELYGLVFIFFVAFNCLEANLPSLISKHAPSNIRGGAMGVYSSSQFLGIFVGGTLSGFVYTTIGAKGIFMINGCLALIWFTLLYSLKLPRKPA